MKLLSILYLPFLLIFCHSNVVEVPINNTETQPIQSDTATFANGCFWCTEAIFNELNGVLSVTSGYTGGNTPHPDYNQVSTGTTNHAECIQIIYNPSVISFDELLEVFFETHDPTTLNRQGADVGTQYRSAVFYHDSTQLSKTEFYIKELNQNGVYDNPIVTTTEPFTVFYPAENYHQQYYQKNKQAPYCRIVITPKLNKFREVFKTKLKKE